MSAPATVFTSHNAAGESFLLLGGDKSTQSKDIKRAKAMAEELDED
jgi:putative component of toxin-antitoxin plasmid stabilization module